ncbi:MAG: transporter permease [Rhodospirillales bacterium]|nr:transporter permease [Rhodospirillales bacterium]
MMAEFGMTVRPGPVPRVVRWLTAPGDLLTVLVEGVTAVLVVAEIVILFSGIVARYVLRAPLVWSDELASILFLWLAVLGAVVALRRGEHMRMTALIAKAAPRRRLFFDMLAVGASLGFPLLLFGAALDFASDEIVVVTPALEISSAWRAAAMPVGAGLMVVTALMRLVRAGDLRVMAGALGLLLAVGAGLYFAAPALGGLGKINLLIFFVGVVGILVLSGVPIAFAFGLASLGYLALTTTLPLDVLIGRMDEGMSHIILLSVPLFVFLGLLIEMTGMSRAMVGFLAGLLGHVRGGLSYVLIGAMYLVSGISGAKAADMAAVAPVLFPEMRKRGATPGDLVALLAATGAQTETIPPSIVLLTIGSVTGVSIAALFTGGLLPGLVLAVTLCSVVWFRYRAEDLSGVVRLSRRAIGRSFVVALPALALPFVIRAAVVKGVATATEVSTIGIVYTIVVGLAVYRQFAWRRLYPMLIETAALSGAIIFIIGTATGMAWCLTRSGFANDLASVMEALPGGAPTFMAVSIVAFVLLGSVLEGIPAIVLFGPLLFPIAKAVGINEVHYAMVVILAMGMGLFSPPFGVGFYVASAIARTDPALAVKPIAGYMLALLAGLILVAAIPWISTGFLPSAR